MTRSDQADNVDSPDTSLRLKDDINRAAQSRRPIFPDTGAAPLGTDDEAAGTPPGLAEIASARAEEGARLSPASALSADGPRPVPPSPPRRTWSLRLIAIIALLGAFAIVSILG